MASCSPRIRSASRSRSCRSSSFSSLASRSAWSISAMRRCSVARRSWWSASRCDTADCMTSAKTCLSRAAWSICTVTACSKDGTKLLSTASCTESAKMPASRRCAKVRSRRLLRWALAMLRETTLRMMLRSCSLCAACCCMRRSISSWRRFSAASMRWASNNSAFRRFSKSSWYLRKDSNSSSSSTSIMLCSSVLPTSTSSTGSHSTSKSKSSPSSICVSMSTPILAGMKRGDGGRSNRKSVCVSASNSTVRSVSSSKYESVWMSMCLRPATGSGVPGLFFGWFARMRRLRCASRCFRTSAASGCVWTMDACVFPRTTRLSYMMLFMRPPESSGRYFLFVTAWGAEAKCCTWPDMAVAALLPRPGWRRSG
mmetsp:Transcript_45502/g.114587  ORF Transcript_45502/g.114587 Transcript_45502/m.114587 type:complete len:370 (-) Transcript_45502:124-1233(-)